MSLVAIGGAAVAGLAVLGAYKFGKTVADTESGCNGHHWGEPYRPDDEGVSAPERKRAFQNNGQYADYPDIARSPRSHLEAKVLRDQVVVRGKAIKKCQDCGERTVVDITVGTVPLSEFESDE